MDGSEFIEGELIKSGWSETKTAFVLMALMTAVFGFGMFIGQHLQIEVKPVHHARIYQA